MVDELGEEEAIQIRLTIRKSKLATLIKALDTMPDGASISRGIREFMAKDDLLDGKAVEVKEVD